MPEGMLITVTVVVHPAAQSYLDAAARTDGATAADREAFKFQQYRESAVTGSYAFEAMGMAVRAAGNGGDAAHHPDREHRGGVGQGGQGRVRGVHAAGAERGDGALQQHAPQSWAASDGAGDREDVPGWAGTALWGD
jgi:hypothetical protein